MGKEYKIVCDPKAISGFDEFVRRQPFFESYDVKHRVHFLRVPNVQKNQNCPDGYAFIDSEGIYFCDNLSGPQSGAQILRELIDWALRYSDKITVEEP